MLTIEHALVESCESSKKPILAIVQQTAVHIVLNGYGFVGRERIGRGYGFITYKKELADYSPDPADPWTYLWFRLRGEDTERLIAESGLPTENGIFPIENIDEIERIAAATFENGIYTRRNDHHGEALAKLFFSLLAPKVPENEPLSAPKRYVKEARRFMDDNYFLGISVTDVARYISVDRKYLCTLFEREMGISTMEYLMNLRLTQAKALLERGDLSVGVVAAAVGYSDSLGFSRIFKKHVGVSPRAYKNGMRPK